MTAVNDVIVGVLNEDHQNYHLSNEEVRESIAIKVDTIGKEWIPDLIEAMKNEGINFPA